MVFGPAHIAVIVKDFAINLCFFLLQKQREKEREKKKANQASPSQSMLKYVGGAVGVVAVVSLAVLVYKRFSPSRFTSYR